ncbi:hypothetical protein F5B21DRAFT_522377 [Xylaria acuta]|nr:hypothetical protein F5B21DRAFT_522377 [Xylaria acuta]
MELPPFRPIRGVFVASWVAKHHAGSSRETLTFEKNRYWEVGIVSRQAESEPARHVPTPRHMDDLPIDTTWQDHLEDAFLDNRTLQRLAAAAIRESGRSIREQTSVPDNFNSASDGGNVPAGHASGSCGRYVPQVRTQMEALPQPRFADVPGDPFLDHGNGNLSQPSRDAISVTGDVNKARRVAGSGAGVHEIADRNPNLGNWSVLQLSQPSQVTAGAAGSHANTIIFHHGSNYDFWGSYDGSRADASTFDKAQVGTTAPARPEEPEGSPLTIIAAQAGVQLQSKIGDQASELRQHLLDFQRQHRLRTGLNNLDGVLQECRGKADAMFSDLIAVRHRDGSRRPATNLRVSRGREPLEMIRLIRPVWSLTLPEKRDIIDTDEIPKYDLQDFPYEDRPKYLTLSYVWGEETLTRAICINGTVVQVRRT